MGDDLVGKHLGHYEALVLIGRGGMGAVYRARDHKLHRDVALKTVLPELTGRPDSLARLRREARAAAALNHPGIATLLDFDEIDGHVFLVYELLLGKSLREVMQQRRLPLGEVLDIGLQVAAALAAAHGAGLVHRDLKPENIWILDGGRVKVLDFGLVKNTAGDHSGDAHVFSSPTTSLPAQSFVTGIGHVVGTPRYMSPEQIEGRDVDHRTDLFALGVVLYELATGTVPFAGSSRADEIARLMSGRPTPPRARNPELPIEFERIVLRLLRHSIHERYPSALDLAADLEAQRRSLSTPEALSVEAPEPEYFLGRNAARWMFFALQLVYFASYVLVFRFEEEIGRAFSDFLGGAWSLRTHTAMLALALIGATVRAFLLPWTALDHRKTGVMHARAFPFFFVLDEAWALVALALLATDYAWLALPLLPFLLFLPFTQRTLIRTAYDGRGGRTSSADAFSRGGIGSRSGSP